MRKIICGIIVLIAMACSNNGKDGFSPEEKEVIGNIKNGIMRVLLVTDEEDFAFLHRETLPLGKTELESKEFRVLQERMLQTVNDTINPGVGIAAPQVGINRQMIAVQRYDQVEGEEEPPFHFYVNPVIEHYSEETVWSPEGCLSVPTIDALLVKRSAEITISYVDLDSYTRDGKITVNDKELKRKTETITGFTAMIFQHEIDHLHGILFYERETKPMPEE